MSHPRGRRARLIVVAIVAAIALVGGTWVVALRFQSPAQRDAAALPPTVQPVVVPVERGDLVERTTVMSTASAQGARTLEIPLSSGVNVVTRAGVSTGADLASGAVVVWINGRPVFALQGAFPLFRDIGPGDTGDDVRMVQQALADLGCAITPDGQFGAFTAQCVTNLYRSVGAEPPTRAVGASDSAEPTTQASSDTTGEDQSTTGATPGVASAAGETSAGAPKTEVFVRASEVMVASGLPVRVLAAPTVGTTMSADTAGLKVAGQGVSLDASVPGSVAARLSTDTTASAEVDGQKIDVRVSSVKSGDAQGQSGGGSDSTVEFVPTQGDIPTEWAGREDVLVTVNLSQPVTGALLVPQRAIATDASGSTSVLVEQDDASFTQVRVTQEACVGGMCAITDVDGIAEGAKVRVDR